MPGRELDQNRRLIGTMLRVLKTPAIATMAAEAGLDFLTLDMEHGCHDWPQLSELAMACRGAGLALFVRVPALAAEYVTRTLGCGAGGVIAPSVETVEQARDLVTMAKYPPQGRRPFASVGGHTAYRPTMLSADVLRDMNTQSVAVAEIDTPAGVENAAEIASVPGISVLMVNPDDLAIAMGFPGDLLSGALQRGIGKVADAARNNGKVFGMHAGAELIVKWAEPNLRFIMHSLDILLLSEGLRNVHSRISTALARGKEDA